MKTKSMFLLVLVVGSLFFSESVFARDHEWTGFIFRNGNPESPDKGGPFRNWQDCFAWGKSKVWRASDKVACGLDCQKDAIGRSYCKSIESEDTAAAAVQKLDAELDAVDAAETASQESVKSSEKAAKRAADRKEKRNKEKLKRKVLVS